MRYSRYGIRMSSVAVILLGMASTLNGQPRDEDLAFDRPEAWAMRYFTAAGLMQGSLPPSRLGKGQFALGFDVANVPTLSKSERTVGFNGTKEENMNKAPLIARPLVHYGLSDRFSLTAAYVPPVEIFDRLKTHLAGLFVNVQAVRSDRFMVGVRLGGQWSEARGDFTCAADIAGVMDPEINPFGCVEPSNDTFTSLTATAEAWVDYRLRTTLPADLFLSVAYSYADLEFDVNALWQGGFRDQRRLSTSGEIWSFSGGVNVTLSDKLSASLAIVHVPLDVRRPPEFSLETNSLTHFRLSVNLLL